MAENGGFGRAAQSAACVSVGDQRTDSRPGSGVGSGSLFDRENRTIRLTPEGEQFLLDARAVLALADKAAANVQKSLHGEIGTLTIAFFVGGTGKFFPAVIREFRHRFPDVHVGLVEMAPAMQHQGLLGGSIDIAFTRPVQPAQAALLRSENFLVEQLYGVMLKNHPLAKRRKISMRGIGRGTVRAK